jgi:uncharacterized OB-fold protein
MDDAEKAEHQEEMARQFALIARRRIGPAFTGRCANCGEVIERPWRWCNEDCREDWMKREGR